MAKEAYYFSHDSNARHDPKILALRSEFGIEGYGIYWVLIEMLREQEEYKLPKKEYIYNAIAMQVQCKNFAKDDAKRFVELCINEFDLLVEDDCFFWSNSLLKRMGKKNELSEKRRAAAKARWKKSSDTNVSADSSNMQNANDMQVYANAMHVDAIKEKESKRNKNIKKEDEEDIAASPQNYTDYINSLKKNERLANIEQFYQSNITMNVPAIATEDMTKWLEGNFFDDPEQVLMMAIREGAMYNAKNWKYISSILIDWNERGYRTVDEIEGHREGRKSNGYSNSKPRNEEDPELEAYKRELDSLSH